MRPKKKKKKKFGKEETKRRPSRSDPIQKNSFLLYSAHFAELRKKKSVNLIEKFASQKRTKATFLC